jgi:hypothetical protein
MSKRHPNKFEKVPKDFYATFDERAYDPLFNSNIVIKNPMFRFYEPCAGELDMVDNLVKRGLTCAGYSDVRETKRSKVVKDALELTKKDLNGADCIITNPPWTLDQRRVLLSMLDHFLLSLEKTTIFLLDADWMHTKNASFHLGKYCTDIVSVGRLKWMPDTTMDGTDNCAWYKFVPHKTRPILFHPRVNETIEHI